MLTVLLSVMMIMMVVAVVVEAVVMIIGNLRATTTKFVNRACAVHGISLPVVVDKVVVVVLKFPNIRSQLTP